jgi:hypothetical protein
MMFHRIRLKTLEMEITQQMSEERRTAARGERECSGEVAGAQLAFGKQNRCGPGSS